MFLQASVCPEGGVWSRGVSVADNHSGETATAADGTHPTGMNSCYQ